MMNGGLKGSRKTKRATESAAARNEGGAVKSAE
jgi:hypothetical protein